MTASSGELAISRHGADRAEALKHELVAVHVDARSELLDNPFYSAERFSDRLNEHFAERNFELVTGHIDGLMVAYAYGASMAADTWWWDHLEGVAHEELKHETGDRTFWLREIVVRKAHQRRGYAHHIHNVLLAGRREERAALFVRIDNPARDMYLRWNWTIVGRLPPQDDSPRFDAMLLALTG